MLDSFENKQKILLNFLQNCQIDGVSEEILDKSLEECGFKAQNKELIFENGLFGLADFYVDDLLTKLLQKINEKPDFAALKIRQKIKFAVMNLFILQKNHRIAVKNLARYFYGFKNLQTQNGLRGLSLAFKISAKLSDEIWHAIGDVSTDFNFYSKRLILSKIIIRAFFVFIKDNSDDLCKTSEFIDGQIENVMKIEKFKVKMKEFSRDFSCQDFDFKKLPFVRLFF